MYIYAVKLVSGEEIIGTSEEYYDNESEFINLYDVFSIQTSYTTETSGAKTHLAPFMIYSDENEQFTFPMRSVILYTNPRQEMIEYYLEFVDDARAARSVAKVNYQKNKLQ